MLIRIRHLRAVLNCEGKKCMPSSFEKNDKKRNHDTHDNQWTAQSPMLPTREPHLILHYFHGLPVAQMDISLQCAGVGWGLRAHLIDCTAHTDADPIKGGWTTLPINGSHFHVSLCWPTPSGCKQLNQSVNQTWFIWPFLSIETQFKVLCNKNTEYDGDLTYAKTYIPSSTPALTHTKRTRLAGTAAQITGHALTLSAERRKWPLKLEMRLMWCCGFYTSCERVTQIPERNVCICIQCLQSAV